MANPTDPATSPPPTGPPSAEPTVVHAPERHRYEIHVDGALAGFATYRRVDGRFVFEHTEIDPSFEGRGLGSHLARGALDDVEAQDERVVPLCPFIRSWLDKHPERSGLVDRPMLDRLAASG
jgi:uncharacterized protein